jgi:hypothetical protein
MSMLFTAVHESGCGTQENVIPATGGSAYSDVLCQTPRHDRDARGVDW